MSSGDDANRRARKRIERLLLVLLVAGGLGAVYLVTSDDPAARYSLETIDDPRPRGVLRGTDREREAREAREAAERYRDRITTQTP